MHAVIRQLLCLSLPTLACAILIGACDDDDCLPGDPVEGPTCECSGGECICPSSGDCGIYCVDACDLQCAGSGSCQFECGAGCHTACTGSGNCNLTVGDDASVECTGSGDCDIHCLGDCNVRCPGQGTCRVQCEPEFVCNVESCPGEIASCPAGLQVCNGGC